MNLYAVRAPDEQYVFIDRKGMIDITNTYTFSHKFGSEREARRFIHDNIQTLMMVFGTHMFDVVIPVWTEQDYQTIFDRMPG
jgi:hypothetical protein